MESWKPVRGFETLYEISDFGRVKSLRPVNLSQRRLLPEQVDFVRDMANKGFSSRKIAPIVGVSQAIVCKIIRGDAYKSPAGKILSPALRRDGYLFVTLSVESTHFHKTIHSMVTEAFIGKRPPNCQVNHKDGNKTNNTLTNLDYVSRKGNMQHALYELGKSKKLTFEQAKDIWYAKQRGEKRATIASKHNVSIHMVTAIWMGKSWRHAR